MQKILGFLSLVLLLCISVQAQTPEQKLKSIYNSHAKDARSDYGTVQQYQSYFTPGFLKLLAAQSRAMAKMNGAGSNFLTSGNGGWGDFEVGQGYQSADTYVVPMKLYCGLRSETVRTDPKARASWPVNKVDVLFTDLGDGWQIFDLKYHALQGHPAYSAREMVRKDTAAIESHLKKNKAK